MYDWDLRACARFNHAHQICCITPSGRGMFKKFGRGSGGGGVLPYPPQIFRLEIHLLASNAVECKCVLMCITVCNVSILLAGMFGRSSWTAHMFINNARPSYSSQSFLRKTHNKELTSDDDRNNSSETSWFFLIIFLFDIFSGRPAFWKKGSRKANSEKKILNVSMCWCVEWQFYPKVIYMQCPLYLSFKRTFLV